MAVLTIFLMITGIIGSTAVGCNSRAQECADTAANGNADGADKCAIIKTLVGCLSSIPAAGCSASDQVMIGQVLQQARQQEHTACNETVTTTEAVGCNMRAQECADERADGVDECAIMKKIVGCLSSIPAAGCSVSDQVMIGQVLQQARQQEHTACNEIVTTTEAVGCYVRTQECAQTASEEKARGIALCTISKNLVECLSSIPAIGCSVADQAMIVQVLQQARQQEHTACNETITTTEAVGCYTKLQECGTKAVDEKGAGLKMCTVANNLMKCLSSIPLSQCSLTTKSLIAQTEQQAQQDQHKYCDAATTPTSTTTQFISCYTKLQECESRAADDKKTGLTLCTISTGLTKCLSSISISRCPMTTQTLIAQAEQQAQREIHKYCGEVDTTTLPTTPKTDRCTLEERTCSERKQSQITTGRALCSANLEFVNCLNDIRRASCINGERLLIKGYLDESNRYIINVCTGSNSRRILSELIITVLGVVATLVYLY